MTGSDSEPAAVKILNDVSKSQSPQENAYTVAIKPHPDAHPDSV